MHSQDMKNLLLYLMLQAPCTLHQQVLIEKVQNGILQILHWLLEIYPTNMIEYLSGKYFVKTGSFVMEAKPHFPSEYQVQKQGLPPTEINLAEALKTLNYTNGLVGKWHLGISKNHVPLNRGFDYQYGFYGASSLYTAERNWSHIINYEHQSFSAQYQWNTGRYGTCECHAHNRQCFYQ